jgi:hypothetical protein
LFIPKSIKQPKDPGIKITNAKINEENSGDIQKVSQVNGYKKKLRPRLSNSSKI